MIDNTACPTLNADQLTLLGAFGRRRAVSLGDVLYREGDGGSDFFVVLSGLVDIVGHVDGKETFIVRLSAGDFLGEMDLLTSQRVFLTARVVADGEVLDIPRPEFRRLIATEPVSDTILAALVARRTALLSDGSDVVRVIGARHSPGSLVMREFLARNRLPHQWLDADTDPDVDRLIGEFGVAGSDLPVVLIGTALLPRAVPGDVAQYLGLSIESIPERCFDLVVVGGGPAGLAASVYAASEGLSTLAVEATAPGGQAGTSSRIENYLGFPAGISGAALTDLAMTQALKFGARLSTPCEAVGLAERSGHLVVVLNDGTEVGGRAVVAASGARYRRLGAPRLREFEGRGVYYAATEVEARLVGGSPVVVVGGGNSAGQAALFLARSGSPVTLAVRGPDLARSMSRYLSDRIEANPDIDLRTDTDVVGLHGHDMLDGVTISTAGRCCELTAAGLFSFIGALPASDWLMGWVAVDKAGFVRTDRALAAGDLGDAWITLGRSPLPFETSQPGLFAVGDVRSGSVKRVASAVGEGSAAIRSVHEHLSRRL